MRISKSILTGLIAGIVFCLSWYLMARSMGFYEVKVYLYRNYISFGLIFIGVATSIYLTKRNGNGLLSFKDALRSGMLYSLVLATIIAVFNYTYYTFISPDTIDFFMSETRKAMEADKVKPEDFQKYLDAARANYGSLRLVPPVLFWGLICSLICGAILQKKDPHAFGAN